MEYESHQCQVTSIGPSECPGLASRALFITRDRDATPQIVELRPKAGLQDLSRLMNEVDAEVCKRNHAILIKAPAYVIDRVELYAEVRDLCVVQVSMSEADVVFTAHKGKDWIRIDPRAYNDDIDKATS